MDSIQYILTTLCRKLLEMCTYGPEHRFLYHLIRSLYLVNISMNEWCILWYSMEHDVKSFDIPPSP